MAGWWASLTSKPEVIGAVVLLLLLVAGVVARMFLRRKPTPEEMERRRRLKIHQEGKMGDGEIEDVEGGLIVYSYSVAGMAYTASQDTTGLEAALPANPMTLIGPVRLKFDPRNPANSIVLCEEWSGLRQTPAPRS